MDEVGDEEGVVIPAEPGGVIVGMAVVFVSISRSIVVVVYSEKKIN
jgi:hypothetical protein